MYTEPAKQGILARPPEPGLEGVTALGGPDRETTMNSLIYFLENEVSRSAKTLARINNLDHRLRGPTPCTNKAELPEPPGESLLLRLEFLCQELQRLNTESQEAMEIIEGMI